MRGSDESDSCAVFRWGRFWGMSFDVLSRNTSASASVDILRQLRKSKKVLDNSETRIGIRMVKDLITI